MPLLLLNEIIFTYIYALMNFHSTTFVITNLNIYLRQLSVSG